MTLDEDLNLRYYMHQLHTSNAHATDQANNTTAVANSDYQSYLN